MIALAARRELWVVCDSTPVQTTALRDKRGSLLLRLILWPRIHVPHPFNENLFCKLRIDIRVY